jgi:hypothetical protein
MRDRTVRIPRPLQELHGERSSVVDLLVVYAAGIVSGALALVFALSRMGGVPWWKAVLLFLVAADTCAGVVANFTASTDRYYARRPGLRWVFIFIHFVEPALLYVLFGGRLAYWCFLYVYTVASASVVNVLEGRARQDVVAAALVTIGIVANLPVSLDVPSLGWFGPVFMLKLILAFAVRRT